MALCPSPQALRVSLAGLATGLVWTLAADSAHAADTVTRRTFGWIETVVVYPGEVVVDAKLDTGANTSSIDAPDLETYSKDGKLRARFSFTNNFGEAAEIDRPVTRIAKIKDLNGPTQNRPVIQIGVCLADRYVLTQVTLFNRSKFDYRLLLGRRFLRGAGAVVDATKKYSAQPRCEGAKSP